MRIMFLSKYLRLVKGRMSCRRHGQKDSESIDYQTVIRLINCTWSLDVIWKRDSKENPILHLSCVTIADQTIVNHGQWLKEITRLVRGISPHCRVLSTESESVRSRLLMAFGATFELRYTPKTHFCLKKLRYEFYYLE